MAKNNNKGFSIAELIVAIAIMTLLLTPILKQLSATLSTNRRAKEQQYAVENAEYVLQYVQTESLDKLGDTTAAGDIYCVSKNISNGEAGNEAKHDCKVCIISGDSIESSLDIEYSTYEYTLNNVELGSRNTVYTRKVVLDDIANRIKVLTYTSDTDEDGDGELDEYRYEIVYNAKTAIDGFELTSEGSMVQYTDGYVSAIVCKKVRGNGSSDPNSLNMGNMHNFDYKQMALINGYTTDYDEQAAGDFYTETMEILKNSDVAADRERWENAIAGTIQLDSRLYMSGMRKLTTISLSDNETEKYYEVRVSVVYENTIQSKFIQKSYDDIYVQRFEYEDSTNKVPPEIYFEYQPFATESVRTAAEQYINYAKNEYILIDNSVKDAKIYLVKPKWDQARIFVNNIMDLQLIADDDTPDPIDTYYYTNEPGDELAGGRSNFTKVNINVASARELNDTNSFTIYTNLDLDDAVTAEGVNADKPQFTLNKPEVYTSAGPMFLVDGETRTAFSVPADYLKKIEDEDSKGDRLYTATITLEPETENANTVIFTGAKGGN
mgnify:CR=1 FL=1